MFAFCQWLHHRKCQWRGVVGQKKLKSCQRSLWTAPNTLMFKAQSSMNTPYPDCKFLYLDRIIVLFAIESWLFFGNTYIYKYRVICHGFCHWGIVLCVYSIIKTWNFWCLNSLLCSETWHNIKNTQKSGKMP